MTVCRDRKQVNGGEPHCLSVSAVVHATKTANCSVSRRRFFFQRQVMESGLKETGVSVHDCLQALSV